MLYRCAPFSYHTRAPAKLRSFNMQLFLEILGQPMADEDLIGYGLHGRHFLDRLDLQWIDLDGYVLQLLLPFPQKNAPPSEGGPHSKIMSFPLAGLGPLGILVNFINLQKLLRG